MKDVYLEKNTYVKLKFRRKGAITKVLSLDTNLLSQPLGEILGPVIDCRSEDMITQCFLL